LDGYFGPEASAGPSSHSALKARRSPSEASKVTIVIGQAVLMPESHIDDALRRWRISAIGAQLHYFLRAPDNLDFDLLRAQTRMLSSELNLAGLFLSSNPNRSSSTD
jgi:hypothetical protein